MAKNSFQFDVTLGKNNYIPVGEVKQSDTMDFSIRVLENDVVKNLTGDTCTLYVSKKDGTILEQKEGINITEATNGTLTIKVKNQATACPGITFFELEFKGDDGVATSGTFLFTVNARVANGEAIQSKDEIHALEQVEKYVKEAKAELQKFKELQTAMLETNNSMNNNEALRVEAESLRVEAEKGRILAEEGREESFKNFEGKINANTEELEAARTATTGENFDTLDERIDCEVDRLNKKIEVSMLGQEDKESHIIENTVEGLTTDMIIKGRILQNIINNKTFTENSGQYNNLTNEYTFSQDWARGGRTTISKNNTVYTVILKVKSTSNLVLRLDYDIEVGNSSVATLICEESSAITHYKLIKKTFNTGSGYNNLTLTARGVGNGIVNVKDFMILEGDYTNKPIPEYFEGIKSFGQQEDKISILTTGANLLDKTKLLQQGTNNPSGYLINGERITFKATGGFYFKIKLEKGEVYYLSSIANNINNIRIYKDTTFSGSPTAQLGSNSTYTHNVETGFYYLRIWTDKIDSYVENMQFESKNKTPYQPYKEDKKDILLSQYGFDEGLRGLNTTVYDELNDMKNMAIKKIEKKIINNNDNIIFEGNLNSLYKYYLTIQNLKPSSIISDYPVTTNHNDWINATKKCILVSDRMSSKSDRVYIVSDLPLEEFKTSLNLNPISLYYELSEPIETHLNENINLKTFNERAYIGFENSISGTSSFKAPVDTTATIARLNRENRALEEENVKLKKGTYINTKDISITKEELQATQSAVDFLLFNNLNAVGTAMLYNGKKEGGGSMGAYLAMRIIKGKLKYDAVMKQYGEFKEDIDLILEAEGYGHLITQQ
ncbi:BppU family phage baseplate upper protein [Clostridium perfringens]|nr:BppU family phage baseplate upper protein [Clostridium perfringens]